MIVETASAKINLYLHVGGVRSDGLHDLASLFVFAECGDDICAAPSDALTLDIKGPFAGALGGAALADNLVYRAAVALRAQAGVRQGARLTLVKNLPVAAGLGGGSADAAATLRALMRLWSVDLSRDELHRLAFALGADVPACLDRAPVHVTGAGERLARADALAPVAVCLVNPMIPLSTGRVFGAFDALPSKPLIPALARRHARTLTGLADLLAETRNDLESPARRLVPAIGSVIDQLNQCHGSLGARMSGSGASVFSLFSSLEAAKRAQRVARMRGWWSASAMLHTGP